MDIIKASTFAAPFKIVQTKVLPIRQAKSDEQEKKNEEALEKNPKAKTNKHHINFFNKWWQLSYGRTDMLSSISKNKRVIVCSRVSARPIFEFMSTEINPNDALTIFNFDDDYTFGVIQSQAHILWYQEKCSTMKGDPRYTTDSIWDTFPFPQKPTISQVKKVAKIAKSLREERSALMELHNYTLRDLYRILEQPGSNPLKKTHKKLDDAVMEAYGFDKRKDVLSQLLVLNDFVFSEIEIGNLVESPGIPKCVIKRNEIISDDCVRLSK